MFEKIVENSFLRFRWNGSTLLDASWRFVEFTRRAETIYVRVDVAPWTFYSKSGTALSAIQATGFLGRGATAKKIIDEKIKEKASVRRAPSSGNPYGRFPEEMEMGVLARYEDLAEIDFEALSDGLGLRVLDEGFIEIYGGYPSSLRDEWDRDWTKVADPAAFRPWALYVRGVIPRYEADGNAVKAVHTALKLPTIDHHPYVTQELKPETLKAYQSLNRKSFDSQNKVMNNNSANDVARLLGLPTGLQPDFSEYSYEWLHLIAFSLGGDGGQAQVPYNLVLGTAKANTAMMSIEAFLKKQVENRSASATVFVFRHSPYEKMGWYCNKIHYSIKFTSSGTSKYTRTEFDPLAHVAPSYGNEEMRRQLSGFKSDPPPRPIGDTMVKPGRTGGRRL